ncbi:Nitrate/nitrite sensor protein (EC 2.7.3.-) [Methylomonas albis]|uniref:EAL domain-containing protein n=1 Tax=Methylomonas albis TaxID=1854563 RepID=A0ABR9CY50_9GAMM|nr:EAL domain-containing protein [Methylomonas albis]MBD9355446.1 EAL domain-containing protein [Methylomonas albis]CAD6878428.1 Nitrate/nitrite sensor protein (EC 2.7.3.-) [Methylomonas albis]
MEKHFHADFYGFVIDNEQGLSFAGKPVSLHPKEFKMLLELVKQAGNRVSKEDLISRVWNDAPTSDESISRCLSILKSTLRRVSPGIEFLIKTEYGQGYRFIGQIGKPATFVNEENFFLLINATRNLIIVKDEQSRWQIANNATLELYGLIGKPWQGKTCSQLAAMCDERYQRYFDACSEADEQAWQARQSLELIRTIVSNDENNQQKRVFEIVKTPLFEANGSRKALIVLGQEISDRLESERQGRLMSRVLSNSDEAVLISDQDNNIVYVNDAFTRITGYTLGEVMGQNPRILASDRHDHDFYAEMWEHLLKEGTWHGEIWDKRKNGNIYPKWLNISTVHDGDGRICNYVAIFSDISKRKADEALLLFLAYHDPLTKLPNRLLLRDRFMQAVGLSARHEAGSVALLFLDLDRFKNINDSLGHEVGDRVLIAVAKRLEAHVREIDTVSRLGGDEFVVVLTDMPNTPAIAHVAQKILDHLSEEFEIDEQRLTSTASIGVALYPHDGDDFETLLKLADTAMYHAKDCGRNTYRFYTDKMNVDALERLRMRNSLAAALTNQEFVLYYQPQFDLISSELIGFEALIRWNHPEAGLMLPHKFISIAEETGQIVPMGEWVIREACRQAKAWQELGYEPVRVAVNLSSMQFKRGDIIKMITDLTDEHNLDPQYIELELTETIMLQDIEYILDIVEKFKSLRFTLSIDDFGTGYSSLAYLKRFRVDKLKIDQSFIRNLEIDRHDLAIVRSIIQLARGFDMHTIAEGVETLGQLDVLRQEGCQEGQGYLFSHPLAADQVVSYLKMRS